MVISTKCRSKAKASYGSFNRSLNNIYAASIHHVIQKYVESIFYSVYLRESNLCGT